MWDKLIKIASKDSSFRRVLLSKISSNQEEDLILETIQEYQKKGDRLGDDYYPTFHILSNVTRLPPSKLRAALKRLESLGKIESFDQGFSKIFRVV